MENSPVFGGVDMRTGEHGFDPLPQPGPVGNAKEHPEDVFVDEVF